MATNTVNFGRELSCTDGLNTGRFVTGVRLVAEACYRRLTTPRGTLRGGETEQNYGFDLAQFIGCTNARQVAASLPARITNELVKDERVESVEVDVVPTTTAAGETSFAISIDVVTGAGPFTLQVGIGAVTVDLLGITEPS